MNPWDDFAARVAEIADIKRALGLAHWDMEVMMPPGGAATRSRTLATLEGLVHERVTDPDLGAILGALAADDTLDAEQSASVRVFRREHDKATKLPKRLVEELAEVTATAYQAWTEAKTAADFTILQPHLERIVELKKQQADAIGWERERYDALLDDYEPGMTAAEVEVLFDGLAAELVPMIDPVIGASGPEPEWLTGQHDDSRRIAFCRWLATHVGFDLASGRVDTSPHPFTLQIGPGDTRPTVQSAAVAPTEAMFTTLHECGHALYDQGLPKTDLPWGEPPSFGMHESQSRLWENHVGRSRAFSAFVLPHMKEYFPELATISPDEFYRGANRPQRSLIRVEADELTYPLHIIVRFQLELALFRDEMTVADLPAAWDAAYEKTVGIRPQNDAEGALQDMHWAIGYLGYFPTYTLGTLYAAGFYATAADALASLDDDLRKGDTSRLLGWLRDNIHSKGYLLPGPDLARSILGGDLSPEPFLDHIRVRYGELYDVTL